MARNRKRKRDKKTRVDLDSLPEKIAEGITVGPESKREARELLAAGKAPTAYAEANEKFPTLPGAVDLSYMLKKTHGPKFRARNAKEPVGAMNFGDDRWFRDVDIIFTREDRQKIERGYMCLRCLEPQDSFNEDRHLEGCPGVAMYGEKYMRDGYMMIDVAAEFVGVEHLGPRRPLSEAVAMQDDRKRRLAWIKNQVERGNHEAARKEYDKLVREAHSATPNAS